MPTVRLSPETGEPSRKKHQWTAPQWKANIVLLSRCVPTVGPTISIKYFKPKRIHMHTPTQTEDEPIKISCSLNLSYCHITALKYGDQGQSNTTGLRRQGHNWHSFHTTAYGHLGEQYSCLLADVAANLPSETRTTAPAAVGNLRPGPQEAGCPEDNMLPYCTYSVRDLHRLRDAGKEGIPFTETLNCRVLAV